MRQGISLGPCRTGQNGARFQRVEPTLDRQSDRLRPGQTGQICHQIERAGRGVVAPDACRWAVQQATHTVRDLLEHGYQGVPLYDPRRDIRQPRQQ